ncbi:phosphoribosylformylglycinamidine cyclo-ligase [Lactiplantibacillus fabifermentans]|uniref:Phosphoribosylformylglycinamidine cyclo-ligase n=2 Tax=Lactiplantibacillus fabifermentans TaxID=483011 RepID=A0A0R2NNH7_9LACO|nr:phosphoribosylformylglycinamidine cyclo-ligase [Lactiplantibacillus fabifermentans]ETY73521.1 phosphoribosylaminoimidazole synthetase [Lactiplantibacillus fabifermentans T30PCM01]KRO27253.1 phosphoribosylaminoimidazole synthetase [Lactiplantibacillus fabifermentans DSM 21115]
MSDAYKKAGVDINAGYEVLKAVKKMSGNAQLGAFGGLFPLSADQTAHEPVLVAGTDGVGTKLLVAIEAHQHATIGIDLVAMCVNDILAQGAKPQFFLDYLGLGHTDTDKVKAIVGGVIEGCRQAGTTLIGGETAEMPDMYGHDHYDLAGFAVGVADRADLLQADNMQAGDILIGLPSNGLHSNGFSLVRDILFKQHQFKLDHVFAELGHDLQTELLRPTKIYVDSVMPLLQAKTVASIAHITGGGLIENVARALPANLSAEFKLGSWPVPPIMSLLAELGDLTSDDVRSTFNLGLGMVLMVHPDQLATVAQLLTAHEQAFYQVGTVNAGSDPVVFAEANHD